MQQIYEDMKTAVLEGDAEQAVSLAELALSEGMDLSDVMNQGFLKGIQEAGKLYEEEEYFLPDLVCAAEAMKGALAVLDTALKAPGSNVTSKGRVLLATVEGDVHDIGKNIVGAMLTAAGYDVTDLGNDVPMETVLEAVSESSPDVLGLSAMLTTTMEVQRKTIWLLAENGSREQIKVIVGGAPVTHSWAETIGADGTADDAIGTVQLLDGFFSGKGDAS